MKNESLDVLVVDDSEDDTLLLKRALQQGEWDIRLHRVDTAENMRQALSNEQWDLVISDYMIPGFGGMEALKLFNTFHLNIPFILISGKITEDMAVEALLGGAQDFILKQNFTRLVPAIRRGVERVHILGEKQKTLDALTKSEALFRTLAAVAPIGIIRTDEDGHCIYANDKWQSITGIDNPCSLDDAALLLTLHPDERDHFLSCVQTMISGKNPFFAGEFRLQKKDGKYVWILAEVAAIYETDTITGFVGTATDISIEKDHEARLIRQKELYRALSLTNQAIVYSESPQELFDEICQIGVNEGKFKDVWIGIIDKETKVMQLKASLGRNADYLSDLNTLFQEKGDRILEHLEEGSELIFNDIDSPDTEFTLFKNMLKKYGYGSFSEFRIGHETYTRGIIAFCSDQKDFFDEEIVALLREMTGDISFALNNFEEAQWRKKAQETLIRNEKTISTLLIDTVSAIATTIEMRDPYTAGHQKRVAALASAIAEKMGLSVDRIQGLQLAAQIHDVGKIHVPAEILSKPTHLTEIEFKLIQVHPEAGHAILKDIEFPWPIATIISQHHEKLDGSGYPNRLKGEDILLEARILTVADIVEAMASHRPYRPALGIQSALDEIRQEKGRTLDGIVVEVCIALFQENNYTF